MVVCIFFNDTATTEIYTLSLHDALPISPHGDPPLQLGREIPGHAAGAEVVGVVVGAADLLVELQDRKSTRLNSSHANISYAVFCLKKKINIDNLNTTA